MKICCVVRENISFSLKGHSPFRTNGTFMVNGTLDLSVPVLWVKLFGHLGKNKDLTDLK